MIKRMIRRWLGIAPEPDYYEATLRETREANSVLSESGPAIMAYRISNGYIVRTFDRGVINQTMKMPVLTYCKDHTDIAEHIVAEQARTALGVGHQYELKLSGGSVTARGSV
jgi:hypothetical protein